MFKVDLNNLGLASYNELIRLKVLKDISRDQLSKEELEEANDIIYHKLGDYLLRQILEYNHGHVVKVDYKGFNEIGGFTQLVLILALCYINKMDLNMYFNLPIEA